MLRTILRVAVRDFLRRPVQTALVVAGLLVSSLVISAALVAADSMEALFLENTYASWGTSDVVIGSVSGLPFPEAIGRQIASDGSLVRLTDARAPRLSMRGTVELPKTSQREPSIRVIGIDATLDNGLGRLVGVGGDELGGIRPGETIINERLADRIDAAVGDRVEVFLAKPTGGAGRMSARVAGIAARGGKADAGRTPNAFFDLKDLQQASGLEGLVTQVALSAKGSDLEPEGASDLKKAASRLAARVSREGPGAKLIVADTKADDIKSASEQSRFFRAILSMLGAIVALASIALITNLFVMLGEERRGEAGALRAMGLKRRGLILLNIMEGMFYSLAAASLGSVLGGFFGRYVADLMGDLFDQFSVDSAFEFARPPFQMRPATLITAGIGGFLVSMASVIYISVKTSRLTVIAAIRGLPEERVKGKRRFILRVIQILAGGAMLPGPELSRLVGGTLLILGAFGLLARVVPPRVAGTLGSLVGLAWGLWANTYLADFEGEPEEAFAIVTLSGVVMVVSFVALITANLNALRRLATGFGPRIRAILKIATSYASGYRFRTAMSMGMFGLVLYMIAAFAIWGGFGSGADIEKQTGGFDILASSTVPVENLRIDGAQELAGLSSRIYTQGYTVGDSQPVHFPAVLYGVNESFARFNDFKFTAKPKGMTDRETWEKFTSSSGFAVIDAATDPGRSEVGDKLVLKTDEGRKEFEVIGVADEFTLAALMISRADFDRLYPGTTGDRAWLIKAPRSSDVSSLARRLEKEYGQAGMDARPIKEIFEERAGVQRTFVGIFQLLLKMGLVIGISGLAIGSVRTVLERRQAIGILRAMGFQASMVGAWLLLESLLVATLGVVVGLGVGLVGTFLLVKEQIPNFSFSVDWYQIRSTLLIIYVSVLIFTALPALRAARLKPSEAVRYVE